MKRIFTLMTTALALGAALAVAGPASAAPGGTERSAAAAYNGPPSAPASAVEAGGPISVTSQFECGILRCTFVFTKSQTRTVAKTALPAAGCAWLPFPASAACAGSYAIAHHVAKLAVEENSCLKLNFVKTFPYPSWYNVDGSSRCK